MNNVGGYKTKIFKDNNLIELEKKLNLFVKNVSEISNMNTITETKFNITNFICILIYKE